MYECEGGGAQVAEGAMVDKGDEARVLKGEKKENKDGLRIETRAGEVKFAVATAATATTIAKTTTATTAAATTKTTQ